MSLQATTWALYDAARDAERNAFMLDANEFRVLMVMADMADQYGRNVYPSKATLAELCGVTPRTIHSKLASLEAKGLIIRDDQRIVEHIPANRRPVAWRLNMTGEPAGEQTVPATETTESSGEKIAPQTTEPDEEASGVKSGVKTDRKSGVQHAFTITNQGRTVEPREYARETKPETSEDAEQRLAAWTPNAEAQALAEHEHADLDAEADKFRCKLLATGHVAKNLDAAFTLWLRRGIESGYLTPARRERPSDTRVAPLPVPHRHRWNCEHVKAIMGPHEGEYDHERAGGIGASEWMLACQETADRLNRDDGIPDVESKLADPAADTGSAALADGSGA